MHFLLLMINKMSTLFHIQDAPLKYFNLKKNETMCLTFKTVTPKVNVSLSHLYSEDIFYFTI